MLEWDHVCFNYLARKVQHGLPAKQEKERINDLACIIFGKTKHAIKWILVKTDLSSCWKLRKSKVALRMIHFSVPMIINLGWYLLLLIFTSSVTTTVIYMYICYLLWLIFHLRKNLENRFKKHTLSNIPFKYWSSKRKYMKTLTCAWEPKFDKQKLVSSL